MYEMSKLQKKIPNSAKYCKYCACPVSGSQVKKKSKGSKLRIVMISVSCCLIVAVGATGYIFYQWYNSPSQEILRELKSEDYKDAVRIFNRNYDEDDDIPEDIVTKVTSILESEYTVFQNEEKSYSAVTNNIDTLSEMNIEELEDEIEEVQDSIDSLNASRTAFDTAESYMEDGNYEDAIAQYKLVIQDDSNYDTAQTRMEEAVTSYHTEVLEDAAEKASSGNVSGAITILKSGLNVLENDSEFTQQLTAYQN
ncbi:MAG: tetratricopeptide repeat protein [Ruminococcus sp.]|nr:tetratricopeptide repeat protein [Ruminococcus sp.]